LIHAEITWHDNDMNIRGICSTVVKYRFAMFILASESCTVGCAWMTFAAIET